MYDKSISLVSYFHIPFSPELTASPPPPHPPLGKVDRQGGGRGIGHVASFSFPHSGHVPHFFPLRITYVTLCSSSYIILYIRISHISLCSSSCVSHNNRTCVSLLTAMSHIPPSFSSMSCIVSLFVTAMFCSLSYASHSSLFSTLYRISLCFFHVSHISFALSLLYHISYSSLNTCILYHIYHCSPSYLTSLYHIILYNLQRFLFLAAP
jgi:hypothetical protein